MNLNLPINYRAISVAIFLPLLYWTGAVIAITLFGYPGVVCMTPMAWLLALPVGARLARESESAARLVLLEGLLAGALLGFWEGVLVGVAMSLAPYVSNYGADLPESWLVVLVSVLVSMPATALIAMASAWLVKRNDKLK